MRKKDGYILAYVMFVLVFLCLVVVVVCSSALDNLTAQNAAVDRMEQRLEAESVAERIIAEIETVAVQSLPEGEAPTKWQTQKDAIIEVQNTFARIVGGDVAWSDSYDTNDESRYNNNPYECRCYVALKTAAQGVQVDATVVFYVSIKVNTHSVMVPTGATNADGTPKLNPDGTPETKPVTKYSGEITSVTSDYHSYAIQYTDGEGGGAE